MNQLCRNACYGFVGGLLVMNGTLRAQTVSQDLSQLRSDVPATRVQALRNLTALSSSTHSPLCSSNASPEVRVGLIAALVKENRRVATAAPGSMSEEEADEYYGNLIGCVSALHDRQALPALADAIGTGGGAIGGVVAFGDAAVPTLVQVMDSKRSDRLAAVLALRDMVAGSGAVKLTPAHVQLIRKHLLDDLADDDRYVRREVVRSLSAFPDAQVRSAILKVASSDTASYMDRGVRHFPVREAARDWLRADSLKSLRTRR